MKKRSKRSRSLIISHLGGIQRALLEGEKRPAFLDFLSRHAPAARGLYALYDKRGRLYYAGKASDLPRRLNQHLKDRHGESWERMTLFVVSNTANVSELEGLLIATTRPPGNKQRPKIGQDLRTALRRHLRDDATVQIDQAIYARPRKVDRLLERITTKRLHKIGQKKLAEVLGISQPRVSQLMSNGEIRAYIRDAGKRDTILSLLQKIEG